MAESRGWNNADPMTTAASVQIQRGTCYAMFAYEIALAINLDDAERLLTSASQRERMKRQHAVPSYFEYHLAPLHVMQEIAPLPLATYVSSHAVDIMPYDFGAASILLPFFPGMAKV